MEREYGPQNTVRKHQLAMSNYITRLPFVAHIEGRDIRSNLLETTTVLDELPVRGVRSGACHAGVLKTLDLVFEGWSFHKYRPSKFLRAITAKKTCAWLMMTHWPSLPSLIPGPAVDKESHDRWVYALRHPCAKSSCVNNYAHCRKFPEWNEKLQARSKEIICFLGMSVLACKVPTINNVGYSTTQTTEYSVGRLERRSVDSVPLHNWLLPFSADGKNLAEDQRA